jgi:hypothetical protein
MPYFPWNEPVTLAPVGNTPNANAASLSGQQLTLQPADASFPGIVTAGTQTLAGAKTFNDPIFLNAASGVGTSYSNPAFRIPLAGTNQLNLLQLGGTSSNDWEFALGYYTGNLTPTISTRATGLMLSMPSGSGLFPLSNVTNDLGGPGNKWRNIYAQNIVTSSTAGVSDISNIIGTSVADASVIDGSKLVSVRTGIGGTESEYLNIKKPGSYGTSVVHIDQKNKTNTYAITIGDLPAGVNGIRMYHGTGQGSSEWGSGVSGDNSSIGIGNVNRNLHFLANSDAYSPAGSPHIQFYSLAAGNRTQFQVKGSQAGATDIVAKIGTSVVDSSVSNTARLLSLRTGIGDASEYEAFSFRRIRTYGQTLTMGPNYSIETDGDLYDLYHGGALKQRFNAGVGHYCYEITHHLVAGAGAGANDVCNTIGTSVADASVNAGAKLLSLKTGIGGTPVEKIYVAKDGTIINPNTGVGFGDYVYNRANGFFYYAGGAQLGMYNQQGSAFIALGLGNGIAYASHSLQTGQGIFAGSGEYYSSAIGGSAQTGKLISGKGAISGDHCWKVGTSVANASVNGYAGGSTGARLLSIMTGLGGTEVERAAFYVDQNYDGGALIFRNTAGNSIGQLYCTSTYGAYLQHSYGSVAVTAAGNPFLSHTYNGLMGNDGTSWYINNLNQAPIKFQSSYATPGASDVALKLGFGAADASVNASAKLLSVQTGMGGTPVEKFYVTKDSTHMVGPSTGYSLRIGERAGGASYQTAFGIYSSGVVDYNSIAIDHSSGSLWVGYGLKVMNSAGTVQMASISSADGTVEINTAGAGVILKSPNGTRFKLTVSNEGALSVVAV